MSDVNLSKPIWIEAKADVCDVNVGFGGDYKPKVHSRMELQITDIALTNKKGKENYKRSSIVPTLRSLKKLVGRSE